MHHDSEGFAPKRRRSRSVLVLGTDQRQLPLDAARQNAKLDLNDPRCREAEMSTLDAADARPRADRSAPAGNASSIDGIGVYLTDEVFLYRVVDFVAGPGDGMVELEDCYWLDVVSVPMTALRARRLRAVMPAPVEG
jgi:hypothetical protein